MIFIKVDFILFFKKTMMKKISSIFIICLVFPVLVMAQNKKDVITSLNQEIDSLYEINAMLNIGSDSLQNVIWEKDKIISKLNKMIATLNDTNKAKTNIIKEKNIKILALQKSINNNNLSPDSLANQSMVTDIDGNVYSTVTIGKQIWMAENLKTTHYCTGNSIRYYLDSTKWNSTTNGAYCNYNNDPSNAIFYGRLYNWYAITDSRNICPKGWHVPTDADWEILTNYLGGEGIAGGKLKSTDTTFWKAPNSYATNEFGFSALAGGIRKADGTFSQMKNYGYWWSLAKENAAVSWYRDLSYNMATVNSYNAFRKNDKREGYCVRCLKD
jgi:uncharacterized protein (TIGR02145 family)